MFDQYLQITNEIIPSSKVKEERKLVLLSDLHINNQKMIKKLKYIKDIIQNINPNYLCILGDIVDNPEILVNDNMIQFIYQFIKDLTLHTPTFLVKGNHDFITYNDKRYQPIYHEPFWQMLNQLDTVHVLNHNNIVDNDILFTGYFQDFSYYYNNNKHHENSEQMLRSLTQYKDIIRKHDNTFNIFLTHSPIAFNNQKIIDLLESYDLILCGHMHDGCIPFGLGNGTRGLISPDKKLFPKKARGSSILTTSTSKEIELIICGGIVKIQNSAHKFLQPLNHLCPMQINTLTLTNNKEPKKEKFLLNKKLH